MWKESIAIVNRGELDPESTAYPMYLQPARPVTGEGRHCMFFHLAMWLSANPNVKNFRMVVDGALTESPVCELRALPLWIMFGRRRDRTSFQRWLNKYRQWFAPHQEMEHEFLPDLPESGQVKLAIISTSFTKMDIMFSDQKQFPEGFVERWSWIITNCKKPVCVMPNRGFGFRNVNEAVHYKLNFGAE